MAIAVLTAANGPGGIGDAVDVIKGYIREAEGPAALSNLTVGLLHVAVRLLHMRAREQGVAPSDSLVELGRWTLDEPDSGQE